jgi:hypothetical protein
MKNIFLSLLLLQAALVARTQPIDSIGFFQDETVMEATLSTDIRALQQQKGDPTFQPGTITLKYPDGSQISEPIGIAPRGVNRRENCRVPPMSLNFRTPGAERLHPLGKLKLVLGCEGTSSEDQELVLKEYLCYKLYNLLTDLSFRVRLLRVTYADTRDRVRGFTQYSFLIEDDGDLARRNGLKKKEHGAILTEATQRQTMTRVALFQYMIGNTDWAVPNNHNIKLLFPRDSLAAAPHVIPYDFDYCGLVDASYAVPNEVIGTEKVTERVYRGFARTMEELQQSLELFREKKNAIFSTIRGFPLLSDRTRKNMENYLTDFFSIIEKKSEVQSIFIDQARTR